MPPPTLNSEEPHKVHLDRRIIWISEHTSCLSERTERHKVH